MNFHCLARYLGLSAHYHAIALFASFVLWAAPLHAASDAPQVYAGTVGTARVVAELEGSGDSVSGRYFYRKYRLDIGLIGTWTGDRLILESRSSGDRLALRRDRSGLAGSLTTRGARKVPVRLAPLDTQAASVDGALSGITGLSLYERQQLADLTLVPGAIRLDGSRSVRDWREPISGITLFRIEKGYPAPALEKINAALERQQWERVSQWFACEGFDGKSGMDISESKAPYLSDDFVSYAWFASWSCAGTAHPDFGTQGYTFDARTGRELQLEDLLYFGQPPAPQAGTSAFYAYRSDVFAPRFVALLRQLYPAEMQLADGEASEDQCDYADTSVWDFPSWYLTSQGLYLGAYFARAQRPCDEPDWSVIPWQHLTRRNTERSLANLPAPRPDALRFGQIELTRDDIERLSLDFDDSGVPGLGIALRPDATKRLEAETIRLLGHDATIALGDKTLIVAGVAEPISEGRMRIGGRVTLYEARDMASQIICTMNLSAEQIDPMGRSGKLPCKPNERQSAPR